MRGDCLMMIILAAVVVVIGLYLVIWGKPSMIRERFSKVCHRRTKENL